MALSLSRFGPEPQHRLCRQAPPLYILCLRRYPVLEAPSASRDRDLALRPGDLRGATLLNSLDQPVLTVRFKVMALYNPLLERLQAPSRHSWLVIE